MPLFQYWLRTRHLMLVNYCCCYQPMTSIYYSLLMWPSFHHLIDASALEFARTWWKETREPLGLFCHHCWRCLEDIQRIRNYHIWILSNWNISLVAGKNARATGCFQNEWNSKRNCECWNTKQQCKRVYLPSKTSNKQWLTSKKMDLRLPPDQRGAKKRRKTADVFGRLLSRSSARWHESYD